jgi:lysozyme
MYSPNEAILLDGLSERIKMFGYCVRKPAQTVEATIDNYYIDFSKAEKAALKHLILQLNPTIVSDGSVIDQDLIYLPNLSPKTELGKYRQALAASADSSRLEREFSHKVESGETLDSISLMYYGNTQQAKVLQRSNLLVDSTIEAGSILRIPAKVDTPAEQGTKSMTLGKLTLWALAKKEYGDPELSKQLVTFNKISDPNKLSADTVIELPLKEVLLSMRRAERLAGHKKPGEALLREKQYVVKEGDTLSSIAKTHCGDPSLWKAIRDYNRLPDAGLTIGQTLTIPNELGASLIEVSSDRNASKRERPSLLSGMRCSGQGIAVVKDFEALYLRAYKCPAGVWTIGYGHTEGVKAGQTLGSAKEAIKLLMGDLLKAEAEVKKHIHRPLTQGQFDALVSGEFNAGWIYLDNGPSQLTKDVNNGASAEKIRERMFSWIKHKKKLKSGETEHVVSPGLVRRRVSEALLFGDAKNPLLSFNEFERLVRRSGGLDVRKIYNSAISAESRAV